jgi:hypothetical protein
MYPKSLYELTIQFNLVLPYFLLYDQLTILGSLLLIHTSKYPCNHVGQLIAPTR